jgi:secondary thiamine-phosphate synthase enzyme
MLEVRSTSRIQLLEITAVVEREVRASGVEEGVCLVYVPHTTAGVTINENADPSVVEDIIRTLDRLVPRSGDYRHAEGNSDAHIKASLVGFSQLIPVRGGRLALGTWQGIFLCEFDGPRRRRVSIMVAATP